VAEFLAAQLQRARCSKAQERKLMTESDSLSDGMKMMCRLE
jgi:hypothetical protein